MNRTHKHSITLGQMGLIRRLSRAVVALALLASALVALASLHVAPLDAASAGVWLAALVLRLCWLPVSRGGWTAPGGKRQRAPRLISVGRTVAAAR